MPIRWFCAATGRGGAHMHSNRRRTQPHIRTYRELHPHVHNLVLPHAHAPQYWEVGQATTDASERTNGRSRWGAVRHSSRSASQARSSSSRSADDKRVRRRRRRLGHVDGNRDARLLIRLLCIAIKLIRPVECVHHVLRSEHAMRLTGEGGRERAGEGGRGRERQDAQ